MPRFRQRSGSPFKLLSAVLVVVFYLLLKQFHGYPTLPPRRLAGPPSVGARIQFSAWDNVTDRADAAKAKTARDAMKYAFHRYRDSAWGSDEIKPLSGIASNSRNGWGAFIVDSATTLALMGLWDELKLSVAHIVAIDFTTTPFLVDPFETTIRYLGGLVSIVDLTDAGQIPDSVIDAQTRDRILAQAVSLANGLAPAYDTPSGLPWPRVNFSSALGSPDPPDVYRRKPWMKEYPHPAIGLARAGSSILENRVLTRLTGDAIYAANATKAWAPLVWSQYIAPWPGMPNGPIDIETGAPVGRQRHWDGGHDSYYEYLLKMTLLSPPKDAYIADYKARFLDAANSLRAYLSSRSATSPTHLTQHLFLSQQDAKWLLNTQSHLACFIPGTLLLGSAHLSQPHLRTFALALLEGCHHVYTSTASHIGPEAWSWVPRLVSEDPVFMPESDRQHIEWNATGFWISNANYKLRPEYLESLFYAYRITGEVRFRDWAWEAWQAIEHECRTEYGFAAVRDVGRSRRFPEKGRIEGRRERANGDASDDAEGADHERWLDEQESFFAAETLKYVWLIFSDVHIASLDRWVFSTEGHVFRMVRSGE